MGEHYRCCGASARLVPTPALGAWDEQERIDAAGRSARCGPAQTRTDPSSAPATRPGQARAAGPRAGNETGQPPERRAPAASAAGDGCRSARLRTVGWAAAATTPLRPSCGPTWIELLPASSRTRRLRPTRNVRDHGGALSGGDAADDRRPGPIAANEQSCELRGQRPASPFPPPRPPGVPGLRGAPLVIPSIRDIKISEDQSPRPQDRVYFTFNYFQGVNDAVNQRLQAPIGYTQVFRYIGGFEKTFLDGQGSVGIRAPLDSVTANSASSRASGNFGGTSTAVGDMSIYGKYILARESRDRKPALRRACDHGTDRPGPVRGL